MFWPYNTSVLVPESALGLFSSIAFLIPDRCYGASAIKCC